MSCWDDRADVTWCAYLCIVNRRSLCSPQIFTHIAALHSGLLAVTREGKLYRWAWTDNACQGGPHPLCDALGLTNERIASMAACSIRASFLTESGKIATLMDDSFKPSGTETTNLGRFEHACTRFARFETDAVTSLAVSETLTVALTSKGRCVGGPCGAAHEVLVCSEL
jgi:E3 ubiquitin-protein ligase EDD1